MLLTGLVFSAALLANPASLLPNSQAVSVRPAVITSDPAAPVAITIPAIELVAPVQTLGLVPGSNQIATPTDINLAGWFDRSTRPSGWGTVFIDGHNPGVFAGLARLTPDDIITLRTADAATYTYRVRENRLVDNSQIDLAALLYPEGVESALVLMTCAGSFVEEIATYDQRTIIIASLI